GLAQIRPHRCRPVRQRRAAARDGADTRPESLRRHSRPRRGRTRRCAAATAGGGMGMPAERLESLPGYGGDTVKNREEAKAIMQKLGYGPDKRPPVKISTRNLAVYRDPAAILIDQLK